MTYTELLVVENRLRALFNIGKKNLTKKYVTDPTIEYYSLSNHTISNYIEKYDDEIAWGEVHEDNPLFFASIIKSDILNTFSLNFETMLHINGTIEFSPSCQFDKKILDRNPLIKELFDTEKRQAKKRPATIDIKNHRDFCFYIYHFFWILEGIIKREDSRLIDDGLSEEESIKELKKYF